MLTLAIDTATSQVGVAIGRDGRTVGAVRLAGGRRHAEELVPAIEFLGRQTGVALAEVSFLAVGLGPGLFTGLRVGVTTARTLAQVLNVPVVGIPSLDLVAYPWRTSTRRIVALIDARRREVFVGRYWPVPGGLQREGEYTVESPAAVAAELLESGGPVLVVGDGAIAHADAFAGLDHVEAVGAAGAYPSVDALVELATARFEREEFDRPDAVQPLYLRRSDAELAHGTP